MGQREGGSVEVVRVGNPRASAVLIVHSRAPAFEGRINRARTRPVAKKPAATRNRSCSHGRLRRPGEGGDGRGRSRWRRSPTACSAAEPDGPADLLGGVDHCRRHAGLIDLDTEGRRSDRGREDAPHGQSDDEQPGRTCVA